jgi:hypothetical protein
MEKANGVGWDGMREKEGEETWDRRLTLAAKQLNPPPNVSLKNSVG